MAKSVEKKLRSKATRGASIAPPVKKRKWSLLLVLLALVAIFFWMGGSVRVFNSLAKSALLDQRVEDADYWIRWSERLSSRSAETLFLRAKIARLRGDTQEMEAHLQAAHKLGYNPRSLQFEQDIAKASIGRLDGGTEQRIQDALDTSPPDIDDIADSYVNGLTALSRFEDAIELLKVWGAAVPSQPRVPYRRARIHEHFHQPDEALEQYRQSLKRDPTYFKAAYHLARVLLQQRNPDEAMKFYLQCNSGPSALAAQVGMANCFRTKGELEEARNTLLKVMEHSFEQTQSSFRSVDEQPERYLAASELGCIETELGEFESARRHLEQALEKFPLDSIGRYSYAVSLRGLGLKEEAELNFSKTRAARQALDEVSAFQEVLRQNPNDTGTRLKIAKAVLEHESERAGVFWVQSVFAYDPNNQQAHQMLVDYFSSKVNPTDEDKMQTNYHREFLKK